MRRYSPYYYTPPRRGFGVRERSPPRRGFGGRERSSPSRSYGGGGVSGGGYGRRGQNYGSLLVRNIPLNCRPEELRIPFERFGLVRDVYIPKHYYTREPRGFAFVQFVDPYDAAEALQRMNGNIYDGREMYVVLASETRKRPEEMRLKAMRRGPSGYRGQSSHYGHPRPRSPSPMRSPHHLLGSGDRYHSRSFSPASRRQENCSLSPGRSHADHRGGPPEERDGYYNPRSYSPEHANADGIDYGVKFGYDSDEARAVWRLSPGRFSRSPGRFSRSPSGSRSRSADLYPTYLLKQ